MLLDKKEFKQLKKENGGLLGYKCPVLATNLRSEQLQNLSCNIQLRQNGIYFNTSGKTKMFISLNILTDVNMNNETIELLTEDEGLITFKIANLKDRVRFYNELQTDLDNEDQKIDLDTYIAEDKKRKQEEYERIKASNPKVQRKVEMERLRNAGRTVHPSEQRSYVPPVDNNIARCPKCKSSSLTANKKGASFAKGAVGVATFGLYGIVAAGHGKNKVLVTCLNCGHQWKAGKK